MISYFRFSVPVRFRACCLGVALFAGPAIAQQPSTGSRPIVAQNALPTAVPFTLLPGANTLGARLTISELGATDTLADAPARLAPNADGTATATITLTADPGTYTARLVSADKKTALSTPSRIIIPGIRREAGAWRLNGAAVVEAGADTVSAPLFFAPNLSRTSKLKLPLPIPSAETSPLTWRTLRLPPLEKWAATPLTPAEIQQQAQRAGGTLLGCEFPVGDGAYALDPATFIAALKSARQAVTAGAPGAAMILEVDGERSQAAALVLEAAAPLFDAVVVRYSAPGDIEKLWPLKVARRLTEEQKDFDLPIFVRFDSLSENPDSENFSLDCLMSGATGIIVPPGQQPAWAQSIDPLSPLLANAVTLEDAPVHRDGGAPVMAAALRRAGRIPLLGRLSKDEKDRGESCLVTLDASTTAADLDAIKRAAFAGNTMYLEGVPSADPQLLARLSDITGTNIKFLPQPVPNDLKLEDPWLFGTAANTQLPVLQSVTLELKQSMAAQTKSEPGLDKLTVPRYAARLTDGAGGIVEYGAGKGRVLWLPHRFAATVDSEERSRYYTAIAGSIQSSLVRIRPSDALQPFPRAALRMSAAKNTLIALFNSAARPSTTQIAARGVAQTVLDGSTGEPVPFTTRGFETTVQTTIPAKGWRIFVFGTNAKDLEKERKGRKQKVSLQ